jgi:hypothetical protein
MLTKYLVLHWFVVFLLNLIGSLCLLLLDTAPQVCLMLYSDSYFPLASFPLELLPVKIEQLATPSVQSTRYESAYSTVKHLHHRLGRLRRSPRFAAFRSAAYAYGSTYSLSTLHVLRSSSSPSIHKESG